MREHYLFVEKYRPKRVADIILPSAIKDQFQAFVDSGSVPNLLLSGGAGVGKTTAAKAMLEELGCEYITINGSMNGGIDTLRDEIKNFATTTSFVGGRKYVILDEADYLNAQSFQPALRNFMEEYSANCGFILTCNFPDKIIKPLHSRCTVIDFKISKTDAPKLAKEFMNRLKGILVEESIEFDPKPLAQYIMQYFPDWRKVLNGIQSYSIKSGKIDEGILVITSDAEIDTVVAFLKEKNFKDMRKWVGESDIDFAYLCRKLYDKMYDYIDKQYIPQAVIILADYQYKSSFAVDQEINTTAMLTELMMSVQFS